MRRDRIPTGKAQLNVFVTEGPLNTLRQLVRANGQTMSWVIDQLIRQEVVTRGGTVPESPPPKRAARR